MADALSVLEASCKKLAARVEKLRAQLEAAETELSENRTAMKVLSRLGVSPIVEGAEDPKVSSQELVRAALPIRESAALTPKDVHLALEDRVSADNVRTILLRLKKGPDVKVTESGRYWRQVESAEPSEPAPTDDFDDFDEPPEPPEPAPFDADLDDVPY